MICLEVLTMDKAIKEVILLILFIGFIFYSPKLITVLIGE
jgi:hypothetical protein